MKNTSHLVAIVLLGFAGAASAQCSVSVTGASFGVYYPFNSAPTETSGAINIACTAGAPYNILLNEGMYSSNNYFPRKMRNMSGISTLEYNLYRDVTFNEVWGDGFGGTYTMTGIATGATQILKIYGRIPLWQNVADGVYTDAIGILVEY